MKINKITEQINSNTVKIDQNSVVDILFSINKEDQKVANIIKKSIPQISRFVEETIQKIKNSGRLIYIGSGTSGRLGILDASECPPTYRTDPGMVQGIIAGGDIALRRSVEGAEDSSPDGAAAILDHEINGNDAVLGISANGNAAYVHGALLDHRRVHLLRQRNDTGSGYCRVLFLWF